MEGSLWSGARVNGKTLKIHRRKDLRDDWKAVARSSVSKGLKDINATALKEVYGEDNVGTKEESVTGAMKILLETHGLATMSNPIAKIWDWAPIGFIGQLAGASMHRHDGSQAFPLTIKDLRDAEHEETMINPYLVTRGGLHEQKVLKAIRKSQRKGKYGGAASPARETIKILSVLGPS